VRLEHHNGVHVAAVDDCALRPLGAPDRDSFALVIEILEIGSRSHNDHVPRSGGVNRLLDRRLLGGNMNLRAGRTVS
jgi:hypothetical protein